jgi:hypothetical protein
MDTFDQSDRKLSVEVKGDVLLTVMQTNVPHNETDDGILSYKLSYCGKWGTQACAAIDRISACYKWLGVIYIFYNAAIL